MPPSTPERTHVFRRSMPFRSSATRRFPAPTPSPACTPRSIPQRRSSPANHLTSYVTVRVRLSIGSAPSCLLKIRKQSGNLMKRRCSPFLPMPYLMRARSADTNVSANMIGAAPVTAFASTRSRHEIPRESEQDRRRRGQAPTEQRTLLIRSRAPSRPIPRARGAGPPYRAYRPRAALTL